MRVPMWGARCRSLIRPEQTLVPPRMDFLDNSVEFALGSLKLFFGHALSRLIPQTHERVNEGIYRGLGFRRGFWHLATNIASLD